jgi:hypothetical protein
MAFRRGLGGLATQASPYWRSWRLPFFIDEPLRRVVVRQINRQAPRLDASVQWKAPLRGRLGANFALTQPAVYANLQQLRPEAADPTPVKDHGWQEAFPAIYPLKINEVRVTGGRIPYVDEGPFAPLEATG